MAAGEEIRVDLENQRDEMILRAQEYEQLVKRRDETISRLKAAGDALARQADGLQRQICINEHEHSIARCPGWPTKERLAWQAARNGWGTK